MKIVIHTGDGGGTVEIEGAEAESSASENSTGERPAADPFDRSNARDAGGPPRELIEPTPETAEEQGEEPFDRSEAGDAGGPPRELIEPTPETDGGRPGTDGD